MISIQKQTKKKFLFNEKALLLLGALLVLILLFWSLNKGMLFSDEAYYLFHLKQPSFTAGYTKWHLYAEPFFQYDTIVKNRFIVVFILILTNIFLAKSIAYFFKNKLFLNYLLILIFAQFATTSPVGYSPSYLIFNQVLCSLAVGAFLICTKNNAYYVKIILGIIFGIMMFNIPTSIGIFLPMLLFDYFRHKQFIKTIHLILFVVLGMLVWLGIYFATIEEFSLFKLNLLEAINVIANDDKHNMGGLLKWHLKIVVYFSPVFLHFFLKYFDFKNIYSNIFYKIYFYIVLMYVIYIAVSNGNYNFIMTPLYLLIIDKALELKLKKEIGFLFFLMLLPYFCALGTDVNLIYRSASYASFMFIALYIAYQNCDQKGLSRFKFIYLIVLINFISYPFRECWEGYKLIEQKIPYAFGGETLYLDQKRYDQLISVKEVIKNKTVFITDHRLYGYALLADAKLDNLIFRKDQDLYNAFININPNGVILNNKMSKIELIQKGNVINFE